MLILVVFKSLPLMGISAIFPLGISYYTFKLAAYLIDVHWGAIEPEPRLIPFLAYTSFFPQIVAGPIQRAQSSLPQIEQANAPRLSDVTYGALRVVLGFFKKFVIADNLGALVDYVYQHLGRAPGAPVMFGFYGYPLQLYADFSALADIAIGAAAMLGIVSPENFEAPFAAPSPSEFWRRWHITLTQWMVDYVFTPLRMSLRGLGNVGLVLSIFVNMVLIGLWHGFYWTFALFGVVHAIFLSIDALTQKYRRRWYKQYPALDRFTDWVGPVVTFHIVAAACVFFRANSLSMVGAVFGHLFAGWDGWAPEFRDLLSRPGRSIELIVAAFVVASCADALRHRVKANWAELKLPRWGRWSIYGCTALSVVLMLCMLCTSGLQSDPFLYAIF
jgi:D-alanyl-lipoteichoic acid acyltransferase DltB (MBOAT superfamily)